jgi:hypothetical protein
MPTYQTAPLYAPVFPTLVHNPYGVQPLRGNTLAHADLPSAGDAYYPSWKREADMAVLARLENNKLKEEAMLQGPFTQKGNFTYTTGRGPGGHAFEGQKLSGGGTIRTAEGETMIQKLLRDRKFQLDAIDQASFDTVSPERVKPVETPADTFVVDQTFGNLLSSLSEGLITPTLLGYTSQIMNFFLTKADKIPDNKFADYDGFLESLAELLNGAFYSAAEQPLDLGRKSKRILQKLEKDIGGMQDFIRDFMNYLGEPTKTKAMRLAGIRNKLLSLINQSAQAGVQKALEVQADFEEGRRFGPGEEGDGGDEGGAPPGGAAGPEAVAPAPRARRGLAPLAPEAQRLEAFGFGPQQLGQGLFGRRY